MSSCGHAFTCLLLLGHPASVWHALLKALYTHKTLPTECHPTLRHVASTNFVDSVLQVNSQAAARPQVLGKQVHGLGVVIQSNTVELLCDVHVANELERLCLTHSQLGLIIRVPQLLQLHQFIVHAEGFVLQARGQAGGGVKGNKGKPATATNKQPKPKRANSLKAAAM